ncbi:NAD(P)H dehydrogenase assembly family protein [Cyanobium sp. Morenito 9A2]|uniref:NAD(P)H dehydrogenase assembly family protein n=1 Tax=Cyanobium sp. Morenito 9A2 TaxID=2823718 RepID=UPI0020CEF2AE|nr:NAD(P)H dehydrogenase assembly family protein [Cyanobium sp. Morenito 9A2]MCP9850516.1 DUF3148 domain-containing protein [Cyanobium sp. Morenito 9A2]
MVDSPSGTPTFAIGDGVRLTSTPAYLKSADPMPMLRPADLIDPEEVGQVVGQRTRGLLTVRFRRGAFLLESSQLEALSGPPPAALS